MQAKVLTRLAVQEWELSPPSGNEDLATELPLSIGSIIAAVLTFKDTGNTKRLDRPLADTRSLAEGYASTGFIGSYQLRA